MCQHAHLDTGAGIQLDKGPISERDRTLLAYIRSIDSSFKVEPEPRGSGCDEDGGSDGEYDGSSSCFCGTLARWWQLDRCGAPLSTCRIQNDQIVFSSRTRNVHLWAYQALWIV